ncbi:hypothetical protein EKO04_005451 [Ascochyta lentis]|uniref:Uncharacterized protein n=1 Tax=Ascochyta lentis TaxID=205686 RepID=A0A8H7MHF6_9PLEO|nr:hypothetical protein EKO04_005451 [Ascochyta lentis]
MSDYGDDYSDYGEEWFYVEEEFMAADDLAEHAVASPPPTTYADEDAAEDWDRFDYFNDLEYASDGYNDAVFQVHDAKGAKAGEKRKRHIKPTSSKKRQRLLGDTEASAMGMSPIVWRSQTDRGLQPKLLDDDAQTYAVFRDWRKKLQDTPQWACGSPPQSPTVQAAREQEAIAEATGTAEPTSPPSEIDAEEESAHEDGMDIDPGALMAALQSRLAEAGGPLSGMDPQQLLDFAMRMATGENAGDDIAGEMADAMFDHGEEGDEEDPEAEANLLSWVAQQRNNGTEPPASAPNSTTTTNDAKRPPTSPKENVGTRASNRTIKASQTAMKSRPHATSSLKRKAGDDDGNEVSTKTTKKRATRTFDAPTAASQARTAPPKTAKGGRKK